VQPQELNQLNIQIALIRRFILVFCNVIADDHLPSRLIALPSEEGYGEVSR